MPLFLSRKAGESVKIGADIFVEVAEIQGGQVRLAITAPPNVKVSRPEPHASAPADEPNSFEPGAV